MDVFYPGSTRPLQQVEASILKKLPESAWNSNPNRRDIDYYALHVHMGIVLPEGRDKRKAK